MTSETDQPALQLTLARRVFVLFTVVLASAGYNAATFSVAAVLPQMQGSLSATADEASWTVTFYILATAVAMPTTGWLVARFGRARVQFWCLAGFAFATLMCGLVNSIEALVIWRLLQGAVGAPIQPLGQTVLLDVFPRHQHGLVISIFGTANTVGPVVGPTLAGYLAEIYGWRAAFFMIVPVALIACAAARFALPEEDPRKREVRLDWIGFIALSLTIGATQLVLSRGQRLDWFESTEILIETGVAILAFYIFIVHSVTARTPFLSPRLLLDRNYAIGLVLIIIFGMLNFTPMVLLPPLMQNLLGFPDGLIGFVVSWRGAGVMGGSAISVFAQRFDPRFGMVGGFAMQIISGLWLMSVDLNVPPATLCANAFLQGLAVGLIWTPIVTTAFRTLDQGLRPEGIAVLHLSRSIGTSFFIAVSVAEVVRVTGETYGRLVEQVSPYNRSLALPSVIGGWTTETVSGMAAIAREIGRQSSLIGYMHAFLMYTAVSVIAIPVVLMLGGPRTAPDADP